jgi:hypothetical protein
MSTPSFQDLLTIPSQDDTLNQEVAPELQRRGVRVTDWLAGAVERANAYVIALLRVSVRTAIAAIAAAGFEDYAFGFSQPPAGPSGEIIDVTSWCDLVAKQRYGVDRIPASYTKRTITLTNASATPYTVQPGNLIIQFPSGNRYFLDSPVGAATGPVTIAASTTTQATFRSEFAADSSAGLFYNDGSGLTPLLLVTANYPGVTASNPAPTFSPVTLVGSSIGTVTPSGSPSSPPHSVVVRIDVTGSVAGSTVGWSTNIDNLGWVTQTGATGVNLGGFGITVTLADNGGSPAFTSGAAYYFQTPGSDITQAGADIETPQVLGTRCRGLIPSMAFAQDGAGNWIPGSPTVGAYQTLALSANSQIRVVLVQTDTAVNDKINIVIAGQGGAPLLAAVVANVQSFFNSLSFITDRPVVATTTGRTITLAGLSITVRSAQLAAAQRELTRRLQLYLGGVDQATLLGINGLIDYDYIIALARTTPGVTKVNGTLTINAAAADLQLPITLGAYESAQWSQTSITAFAWTTVT